MGVRYWQDKTKELRQYFIKVRERMPDDFAHFNHVKVNFLFRDPPDTDSDGLGGETIIAGYAKKLGNKERDIYGYDFEICMAAAVWKEATKKQKFRLMWHEMTHCQIDYEEDEATPARDKDGRVRTWIKPHDVLMRTFYEEVEKFGLEPGERAQIEKMLESHEKYQRVADAKAAARARRRASSQDSDEEPRKKKKKKKKRRDPADTGRGPRRRKREESDD